MINITIITYLPGLYPGILGTSVIGSALNKNWSLNVLNIRDYALDKHKTIDDKPYSGGAGMIMRPDVLANCLDSFDENKKIFHMSPRGRVFDQNYAKEISKYSDIIIICSRFRGIDQRIIEYYNIEEISIGSFIISNGDLSAMVVIDACVRLIPGVLGNENSILNESFSNDDCSSFEHDLYTKPRIFRDLEVPKVLQNGNHAEIEKWKNKI